eukprot:scaffold33654_cov193-Skeletonema_dohrnii-CCMP3373.AAC.4
MVHGSDTDAGKEVTTNAMTEGRERAPERSDCAREGTPSTGIGVAASGSETLNVRVTQKRNFSGVAE